MKVSIARALSIKKRLVGEIEKTANIIRENNSWRSDNTPEYDAKEMFQKLVQLKGRLIKIKTIISLANDKIQEKIFELSEQKDLIKTVKTIDTKKGKHHESIGRFGGDSVEIDYSCGISRKELDEIISKAQDKIDNIQAELDHHNAITMVEIPDE